MTVSHRPRCALEGVAVRNERFTAAVREVYQKGGAFCPVTVEEDEGPSSGAQQFVEGMTS
ncbi:hypothetical protein [Salinibacter sp.]|uniref:hypothetical protein n=1 Tax=Salinibacter sp. TaxID=2065818 RepID=UPI002FC3B4BA